MYRNSSKSTQKSRRYNEWSDWIWNPDYQRYYRSREDANGNVDYDWADPSTSAGADQTTPREVSAHEPVMDELTAGFADLQTPSASGAYDTLAAPDYTVSSGSHRRSRSRSTNPVPSSRSRGKQRSYANYEDEVAHDPGAGPSEHYPATHEEPDTYYDAATGQYYTYPDNRRASDASSAYATSSEYPKARSNRHESSRNSQYARDEPRSSHNPYDDPRYSNHAYDAPADPNPIYDDPRASGHHFDDSRGSRRSHDAPRNRRYSQVGSRSAQPYQGNAPQDELDYDRDYQAAIAASRNHQTYQAGESSTAAYAPYDDEDEGPPTPTLEAPGTESHIAADDNVEVLDPRYRVEHSSRFQPGEIFKILWSEPQGSGNDGAPSISDRREFRDKFGGKFFVGFRRFIVIANDLGHCTCVPILTYGGKACKKRGVKPEKHGIIYERGHKARLLSNEPKLGFPPVKVDITQEGEKLAKESRVNYSKLVTIEHNIKVFFIGMVTANDWETVSDAVNRCWEEKIHHKRKHFK